MVLLLTDDRSSTGDSGAAVIVCGGRWRILVAGAEAMEVIFPPELEAKLTDSAARQGREPDQLVRDVVSRYFEEETRFTEAVRRGEEAFERGEFLTHEQVGERLQRFLRP